MALTQTGIFIDSPNVNWQGALGWAEYPEDQFMGGSTTWARFNDSTWIAATFNGIMVSYYGNGAESVPWNYTSIVDGVSTGLHPISQQPGYDQSTFQWYNSAALSEGSHLINLTGVSQGAAIDYVVVQPSQTQNLRGQVLIVDQTDSLVKYTGSWTEVTGAYLRIPKRIVTPFNGTTHTTSKVGDVIQFPFTGNDIRVYGFFDWTVSGQLSLSYTIDDQPADVIQYPLTGTTQGSFLVQPNYLFYAKEVAAGDHVLTINVTEVTGSQKVIIDTFQYNATFDTLATMPQISLPVIVLPSVTTSPSSSAFSNSKRVNVGGIAGGVVAGVLVLITVAICFLRIRRKRASSQEEVVHPYPVMSEAQLVTEPFISSTRDGTHMEWRRGHSVSGSTSSLPTTIPSTSLTSSTSVARRVIPTKNLQLVTAGVDAAPGPQSPPPHSPPPYQ